MTFWQWLQETVKDGSAEGEDVLQAVAALAARDQQTPEAVVLALLGQALQARQHADGVRRKWEMLSPREKQVAGLVCRRLTNRQIAAELVLSPETIRTHVRNTLRKFSLHSRRDLRHLLADHHFDTFPE